MCWLSWSCSVCADDKKCTIVLPSYHCPREIWLCHWVRARLSRTSFLSAAAPSIVLCSLWITGCTVNCWLIRQVVTEEPPVSGWLSKANWARPLTRSFNPSVMALHRYESWSINYEQNSHISWGVKAWLLLTVANSNAASPSPHRKHSQSGCSEFQAVFPLLYYINKQVSYTLGVVFPNIWNKTLQWCN